MSLWTHCNIKMSVDASQITEEEIRELLGTPYTWEDMGKAYSLSKNGDDSLSDLYYKNNPIVAGSEGSIQYTIEKIKPWKDSTYEEYQIIAKGNLRNYWQTKGILDWCLRLSKVDSNGIDRLDVDTAEIDMEGVAPYIFSKTYCSKNWECSRIIKDKDFEEFSRWRDLKPKDKKRYEKEIRW